MDLADAVAALDALAATDYEGQAFRHVSIGRDALSRAKEDLVLTEAESAHLERAIYPAALAKAGEADSHRNRAIAASDYWQFLQAGGGTDAEAIALLARGLRSCDAR